MADDDWETDPDYELKLTEQERRRAGSQAQLDEQRKSREALTAHNGLAKIHSDAQAAHERSSAKDVLELRRGRGAELSSRSPSGAAQTPGNETTRVMTTAAAEETATHVAAPAKPAPQTPVTAPAKPTPQTPVTAPAQPTPQAPVAAPPKPTPQAPATAPPPPVWLKMLDAMTFGCASCRQPVRPRT